jgi:hypothetical protein
MLDLEGHATAPEEDEMYPVSSQELAAQRIAELHRQSARQRLIRQLQHERGRADLRRPVRRRWRVRQPRPAGA